MLMKMNPDTWPQSEKYPVNNGMAVFKVYTSRIWSRLGLVCCQQDLIS